MLYLQEKSFFFIKFKNCTKTDTGRQVENTKGREITLSKELGKLTS